MTPELWQRLKPLYEAALDTPLERREEFVAQACGDDGELRREFEALLAANSDETRSFDRPLVNFHGHLPAAQSFSEEMVILDRFRVVRLLGHGGMGEVYEVEDRFLQGVHVALKTILPHISDDRDLRRRFEREVLLAREVTHPNLCPIYDIFHSDEPPPGLLFLTMKFLPGCTLGERLKRQIPISVQDRVTILKQTLIGLAAIHSAGIIHRDIKPGNVMLDGTGAGLRLWITDFGLARGYENAPTVSMQALVAGTPGYLAPELFLGHLPSPASDLFALGVMLHEVFTGEKPGSGPGGSSHVVSSRLMSPDVPSYCANLIRGCLSDDPARRPLAFAEALKAIEPKLERGRNPWLTRRRAWVWPLALAAALILAYFVRPILPPPSVTSLTRLTHGGEADLLPYGDYLPVPLLTDGARIYFTQESFGKQELMQVSDEGGESVPVQSPPSLTKIADISANGADLLVQTQPAKDFDFALWNLPVIGGDPRRLGALFVHDAAWTPDGREIYYSSGRFIFRAKHDGSEARKVLTVDGYPFWIRFAPDGRTFRFSQFSNLNDGFSLWEAQIDGSNLRHLLGGGNGPSNVCCGSWSGDGRYFIFQGHRPGSWNLWAVREKPDLWRKINPKPVQLTLGEMNAQAALPSKDKHRIYFIGTTPRGEMMRFNPKTQKFVSYLPGLSAEGLSFTRDGEKMAYVSFPDGILWRSKADGSDRHQLTFAPMQAELPRWSPDGTRIAFTGAMPGQPGKVYLISPEGGNPEQITFGDSGDVDAFWSPDGDSLAFGNDIEIGKEHSIRILNLKTKQVTSVPGSEGLFSPRWSPDGRYLLALAAEDYKPKLFDFNTRTWQKLSDIPASYPSWNKDGSCIYFNNGDDRTLPIYRICLKDRKPVVVVHLADAGKLALGRAGSWTGLGPDESILGTRDTSIQEIYALDVNLP